MNTVSLKAYAKINLGLSILEKRSDGYHDIATIFQLIDLCDLLTFEKQSEGIRIEAGGIKVPLGADNLVHRTYLQFQKITGQNEGLKISMQKNIPIGGGLGGGSSNAASTLIACNQLFGDPLSDEKLREIAIGIGSDVPFFLHGGTAFGLGRGEILETLEIDTNYWIVLLLPQISISTAWAYGKAKITLTKAEKLAKFMALFKRFDYHALRLVLVNDFEDVVFQRHPELYNLKNELYTQGAFYASMSGSGSAIYGLFESEREARAVKTFFSIQNELKVYLCQPISMWK